ncbi:MAG: (2Fe-2S)-binding protein [Firmicutes bacterium]|nr:(2Fe-2S)-binding protein [Bacillota bacterium]
MRSLVKEEKAVEAGGDARYNICTTPDCQVVYYALDQEGKATGLLFHKKDLRVGVWFKEAHNPEIRDKTPICYCSDLARGEIAQAVRAGCGTIEEVRRFTGANTEGQCLTKNPMGKCCHLVFMEAINELLTPGSENR